jgi:hypothetical protein
MTVWEIYSLYGSHMILGESHAAGTGAGNGTGSIAACRGAHWASQWQRNTGVGLATGSYDSSRWTGGEDPQGSYTEGTTWGRSSANGAI